MAEGQQTIPARLRRGNHECRLNKAGVGAGWPATALTRDRPPALLSRCDGKSLSNKKVRRTRRTCWREKQPQQTLGTQVLLTFDPQLLYVGLDGRHAEPHRQRPKRQESDKEKLPTVSLDVAAQGEEEGLEPGPEPHRTFLVDLSLEVEGGRRSIKTNDATKVHRKESLSEM